jgi:quercetin dioxygenase-like cupin family protein
MSDTFDSFETFESFDTFEQRKLAEGHDEVLIREWAPHFSNEDHSHPFDTDAVVVKGEFWLTMDKITQHYQAGDRFVVGREVIHQERYGAEGATFWAARKN